MLPWPCSSIRAPNSWTQSIVPLMSTARTWSIDSSVMSRHDICSRATSPTLFTRTSTPSSRSKAASAMALICSQSTMSACSSTGSAALRRDPVGRPLGPLDGAAVVDADGAGALLGGAYRDLGAEAGAGAGDDDRPALQAARYGNGCERHGVSFRWWVVVDSGRSDQDAAAVDVQDLAGDEAGPVRGEERDRVGHLLGSAEPLRRDERFQALPVVVLGRGSPWSGRSRCSRARRR